MPPAPPRPGAPGAHGATTVPAMPAVRGDDPTRPFRKLEEGATREQIDFAMHEALSTYANEYHALKAERINVFARLDENNRKLDQLINDAAHERTERRALAGDVRGLRNDVEDIRNKVVELEVQLNTVVHDVESLQSIAANDPGGGVPPHAAVAAAPGIEGLPPMRNRLTSVNTHEIAVAGGVEIARRYEAEAGASGTPSIPPPAKVADIGEDVLKIAINQVKAKQYDDLLEERKAAATTQRRLAVSAKNSRLKFWIALGLAAIAVAERIIEHLVK